MNRLQAIVFDFDGVIANSEPLHLQAFQQALREDGIELSARDYYTRYLGYDDVGMFQALARDRGLAMSDRDVTALVARKGLKLQALLQAARSVWPDRWTTLLQDADGKVLSTRTAGGFVGVVFGLHAYGAP